LFSHCILSFVWTYFQVEETEKTGIEPLLDIAGAGKPVSLTMTAAAAFRTRRKPAILETLPEKTGLQGIPSKKLPCNDSK
jgi:hypothetical protein